MATCDVCKEHVLTNVKKSNTKNLYITKVTPTYLKTLSDNDLLFMYESIQHGLNICKNCRDLCHQGKCSERDRKALGHIGQPGPYVFRIMTDKQDLQKIENEISKRIAGRRK